MPSFTKVRALAAFSALVLPLSASAEELGVRIANLHVAPSSDAKTRLKLGKSSEFEVVGKSDDGKWIRVRTELDRGGRAVSIEGWVAAINVRGYEDAGAPEPAAAGGWGDAGSGDSWGSESGGDSWGGETAAAGGGDSWGSADAGDDWGATASTPSTSMAADDPWGSTAPAPAASTDDWGSTDSAASSDDDWGSTDSAASSGDDWGSSDTSSGDDWGSGDAGGSGGSDDWGSEGSDDYEW